ncbi:putative signal transducing protein [Chitinophaga dinghuensis]|uniref:Putative signal transducing protein n=1 Tax=Chitinophaga dinghuensis TaxID=1539050 RepID=A0A327W7Q2_9BACT|nr:DUF2007 domain-containing protein [Chitinophaga dinghuensis]RAJ85403.1 putative signal transducing protein [Chitinophaga dinghuensis]
MEKGWVKVFASDRPYETEIVKGMLQENGIDAVILNRQSSSYTFTIPGQVELYVPEAQADSAKNLVTQHNNAPTGDPYELDEEENDEEDHE